MESEHKNNLVLSSQISMPPNHAKIVTVKSQEQQHNSSDWSRRGQQVTRALVCLCE